MAYVLIVYDTKEGQSHAVAEFAAAAVREAGHTLEVLDLAKLRPGRLAPHPDAVLVVASIHYGKHTAEALQFVRQHHALLCSVPSAFFCVCLSAAQPDDPVRRDEAAGYVASFLGQTDWQPHVAVPVAGALRYSRYGFFKRQMLKKVAKEGGLPTDTSRDHVFTDWDAVRRHTTALLAQLADREETAAPPTVA